MSRTSTKRPDEPLRLGEIDPHPGTAHVPRALYRSLGREALDLGARRAITLLWHNAHRNLLAEDATYAIELSQIASPGHKGTEMPRRIVRRLMAQELTFDLPDGPDRSGGARRLAAPFLVWSDLGAQDQVPGVLRYRLPPDLVGAAMRSRLHAEVDLRILVRLTSRYALPLYELVCALPLRYGTGGITLPLGDLRAAIGVRRSGYRDYNDLKREVLAPALDEIAALMATRLDLRSEKLGRRVGFVSIGRRDYGHEPEDEAAGTEAWQHKWEEFDLPRQGRRERVKGTSTQHAPRPSRAKTSWNGAW